MHSRPFNIAHQGASGHAPSNTLAAFRRAVDMGADIIEIDVVTTADGVVVVSHDTTVDRHTTGSGRINEMTVAELQGLDAGTPFGPQFAGEPIPTLAETLDWAIDQPIRLCIEIKGDSVEQYLNHTRAVVPLLQQHVFMSRVTITSFNPECIRLVKNLEPRLATALDPDKQDGTYSPWELVCKTLECNANFLLHKSSALTAEIVHEAHQHGFGVWTWVVNAAEDMRRAISVGVDGIMTNYPDVLAQVLKEHGK